MRTITNYRRRGGEYGHGQLVCGLMLQIIAAAVLALFIGAEATVSFAVFAAASVGIFWVAPALGIIGLFEQRPFAHWAVNAGYHVVSFTTMGVILGLWR